jgi:hypothetical protein
MTHPLRHALASPSIALATALLALVGGGCVRRQQTPDDQMLRAASEEASSGVVAIATTLPDSPSHLTLCSGALVAPNLVLTARHCVSRAVTATPSCDARGRSHNGDHLAEDVDPPAIAVYVGAHVRPDVDAPVARAVRTLHPTGQVLCDADVAFLVLDRPIPNSTILSMRLHGPVERGDVVVPVGFGGGTSNIVGRKVARERSTVLATGPSANASTGAVLGPREFEVDRATCRGDSGGPAIDAMTGEIVGVVSRGGSCTAHGNHVYTRVDAYKRLATAAFAAADRESSVNVASREVARLPDRERPIRRRR